MDTNKETNTTEKSKKNLLFGLLAALAAFLGFFFYQNTTKTEAEIPKIEMEEQKIENRITNTTAVEPTTTVTQEAAPKPIVVEPAKPVDQPPKPKRKPKPSKNSSNNQKTDQMAYNPDDFRAVPFFENMTSKNAVSPARMTSPTDNALILPDSKGEYFFQLAVDLICEKDDRIAIFPNKIAAFDAEKPLYRHVFPTEHKGPWKQLIKLDSKAGLHYVILQQPSGNRVLGKFILN